jgi:hypothetical protein
LIAAAPKGTEVHVYKAGHELNDEATRQRLDWLARVLVAVKGEGRREKGE